MGETDMILVCTPLPHETATPPQQLKLGSLSEYSLGAVCDIRVCVRLECLGDVQGDIPWRCSAGRGVGPLRTERCPGLPFLLQNLCSAEAQPEMASCPQHFTASFSY